MPILQDIINNWEMDYLTSDEAREKRSQLLFQRGELEKMMKDYSYMRGDRYEDYEMSVSRKEVQAACFEVMRDCEWELKRMKALDTLLNEMYDMLVRIWGVCYSRSQNKRVINTGWR